MEQFSIQTSQNISINQSFASVADRMVAALIDFVFIGAYLFITIGITGLISQPAIASIFGLPVLFYHLIFEQAMDGQSPGKSIMKIKVYSESGAKPGFTSIFVRWVFRIIDVTAMLGSIATCTIIVSKKNKRLGDLAAGTIVLSTRKKSTQASLYVNLPNNYELQFPEVSMLNENDIKTINEVVQFYVSTKNKKEARLYALETKTRIAKKMGIDPNTEAITFLKALVNDYNFINSK